MPASLPLTKPCPFAETSAVGGVGGCCGGGGWILDWVLWVEGVNVVGEEKWVVRCMAGWVCGKRKLQLLIINPPLPPTTTPPHHYTPSPPPSHHYHPHLQLQGRQLGKHLITLAHCFCLLLRTCRQLTLQLSCLWLFVVRVGSLFVVVRCVYLFVFHGVCLWLCLFVYGCFLFFGMFVVHRRTNVVFNEPIFSERLFSMFSKLEHRVV